MYELRSSRGWQLNTLSTRKQASQNCSRSTGSLVQRPLKALFLDQQEPPKLKETYPEVVESAKFFAAGETLVSLEEERFYEKDVFFVRFLGK